MKSSILVFAFIYCFCLLTGISCRKDFNSSGDNGIDTTRLLKQFRIYYQSGVQPDSIITQVSYDTVKRTIILKQYFDGYLGGAISWKYTYNAERYLTGVYDITHGGAGNPIITVFYNGNNEIDRIIAFDGPIDTIPYSTAFTSTGKTVTFFDTSESGSLGGSRIGIGKIVYNNQGQITFRGLTGGKQISPYFDTTQQKSITHEFFSYDAAGNLAVYQYGGEYLYNANGSGDNLPASILQEIYSQHDTVGHELYVFEQTLLKGVINKLSGNAIIDPLQDVVGAHQTYTFQTVKSPALQANIRASYNIGTNTWHYQTLINKPVYDSIGRLTKSTLFDSDSGIGSADIYLDY